MFDKEEQRRRAAEFAASQLAAGAKPVQLPPIQLTKHIVSAGSAWRGPAIPSVKQPVVAAPKVKAPKKPKYLEVPFQNSIGQMIHPGERVIAVAQGYSHAIKIREAVYVGLHRTPNGKVSSVVIEAEASLGAYFMPDGSKAKSWNTPGAKYGTYKAFRKTALPSKRIFAIK